MTYPPGVMAPREGVCNMILIRSIWWRKQPCYCNSQTRRCLSDSSLHKARERSSLALLPYIPFETYCPKTGTIDISREFDLATSCTCQPLQVSSLKSLTLRRLMSYIYMEHPFLMFLDHTQRRSTVGRAPLDE